MLLALKCMIRMISHLALLFREKNNLNDAASIVSVITINSLTRIMVT